MMQRWSRSRSAHRSPVGPCPCGVFHAPGSCLCVLYADDGVDGNFAGGVDCTLSLSTPSSTRTLSSHERSRTSDLCRDMFQPGKQQESIGGAGAFSRGRGGGAGGEATLAARRCANCDATSTPLWRNGPRGPKSLCNACGIRYKKEERRASSTAAEVGGQRQQQQQRHSQAYSSWAYAHQTHKGAAVVPSTTTEFRSLIHGVEESSNYSSSDAPFLPWQLNVRGSSPGHLHDFS